MTEISNVKVYDLKECMLASGYPMKVNVDDGESFESAIKRCRKLANTQMGSGHGNFLTGIRVSFDIKYPQYLTPQLQRYNFIDIVSSQSKMHRLKAIDIKSSCNKYTDSRSIDIAEEKKDAFNSDPSYVNFMKLISSLPMGFELTMRVSTNYMQLKTIYNQRKNHKLKEDWGAIIDMIKKLPLSELITEGNKK